MPVPDDVQMAPLRSSNVAAAGFSEVEQTLYVSFHSGAVYAYSGVPSSVYAELIGSRSPGTFVNTTLRNGYPARRV